MEALPLFAVLAAVCFTLELFLPGGLFGLFAVAAGSVCVWLSVVHYGWTQGALAFFLVLLLTGALFYLEIKILPKTKAGKEALRGATMHAAASAAQAEDSILKREGKTATVLAPTGRVEIDGKIYEAASQGELIEKGERIAVVRQDNFRLIVRKL